MDNINKINKDNQLQQTSLSILNGLLASRRNTLSEMSDSLISDYVKCSIRIAKEHIKQLNKNNKEDEL